MRAGDERGADGALDNAAIDQAAAGSENTTICAVAVAGAPAAAAIKEQPSGGGAQGEGAEDRLAEGAVRRATHEIREPWPIEADQHQYVVRQQHPHEPFPLAQRRHLKVAEAT